MVVECPGRALKPSAFGLADVMKQGSPAQPQVVATAAHIVEHLKSVIEIILVGNTILCLNNVECCKFGHDELEKSAAMEINKTATWSGRHENLIEFVLDALTTDDIDTLGIAREGIEGLVLDHEIELGCEAHATQHAQGVVGEGDVGVERSGNDTILEVV